MNIENGTKVALSLFIMEAKVYHFRNRINLTLSPLSFTIVNKTCHVYKLQSNKNPIFDKEYVKVKRDTFDSMNNVIKETKKTIEFQPKLEQLFNEVNNFTKSHQTLEKENNNLKREIKSLTTINQNLTNENNNLKHYFKAILEAIKHFFRGLLQTGNDKTKKRTTSEIKDYYDNKDFDSNDIYDISNGTTKEDELFDYAEDDFEIGL